ncbi:MAG TPA: hypothetical protein DCS23_03630 [Candidatus Yonathbacteria bacterium]|nr:hypothetical protein [Candidatus Yonathbacteria bacterium]
MEEQPQKLEFTDTEFEKIRGEAETLYKTFGAVHCPYFGEKINFNTDGLEHLKFKSWNRARSKSDQFMRLKLLRLAPETILNSKTLQGVFEDKLFVRKKKNKRWEKILTDVTYYEFVAVLERKRVKVIVKQVLGGEKFFWTLIPYWRTNDLHKRVLHDGNPELD